MVDSFEYGQTVVVGHHIDDPPFGSFLSMQKIHQPDNQAFAAPFAVYRERLGIVEDNPL
jgi:hypothetical protein